MAINPLKESDFARITTELANLRDAEELLVKAKQAGIDVSAQEAQLKQTRDGLLKLKQAFFPNR
jgi:hypothetical protein